MVWWRSRTSIAVIGSAVIAAFDVLREHYARILSVLPYLLLPVSP